MLYSILKTIVDTTITQYICQSCNQKIDENSVVVWETSDTQIHLDITCPHCAANAQIHAEVANVTANIIHARQWVHLSGNKNVIKDTDIQAIHDNLQNVHSIEDLLK